MVHGPCETTNVFEQASYAIPVTPPLQRMFGIKIVDIAWHGLVSFATSNREVVAPVVDEAAHRNRSLVESIAMPPITKFGGSADR
jgi:hypothetical protein